MMGLMLGLVLRIGTIMFGIRIGTLVVGSLVSAYFIILIYLIDIWYDYKEK